VVIFGVGIRIMAASILSVDVDVAIAARLRMIRIVPCFAPPVVPSASPPLHVVRGVGIMPSSSPPSTTIASNAVAVAIAIAIAIDIAAGTGPPSPLGVVARTSAVVAAIASRASDVGRGDGLVAVVGIRVVTSTSTSSARMPVGVVPPLRPPREGGGGSRHLDYSSSTADEPSTVIPAGRRRRDYVIRGRAQIRRRDGGNVLVVVPAVAVVGSRRATPDTRTTSIVRPFAAPARVQVSHDDAETIQPRQSRWDARGIVVVVIVPETTMGRWPMSSMTSSRAEVVGNRRRRHQRHRICCI
jgi:hypothetical protein